MKKVVSGLLCAILLCAVCLFPAAAEPWRPYEPAEHRVWESTVDGIRFDGFPTIRAIDLNDKIQDASTCTKKPVSVYRVARDGELALYTSMLFSIYEPGVLIPRETVITPDTGEQEKAICLLDAEEFILRSDSGTLFDDVDEISFTVRDYFHGLRNLNYDLTVPLLREPMFDFVKSDGEKTNELRICFGYLYGPAYPALFERFDDTKTLTIDVCLGDEVIKSVAAVPTEFDPQKADMIVRLQGEDSVNLQNLSCYEIIGSGDDTAGRELYSFRLHVPEGLLLCGPVKNSAQTVDDVVCVGVPERGVKIELPTWFPTVRQIVQRIRVPDLRRMLEKSVSFVFVIIRPNEVAALLQFYKDVGGTEPYTAADLIRTLLF